MDTGGNTGTQSATLTIRGIALGSLDQHSIMRLFGQELATGAFMGTILAAIAFLRSYLFSGQDLMLSLVIGLSLGVIVLFANLVGLLLPLVAKMLRLDPAVMAGPFITTLIDVTGLILYFETARFLLGIM